MSQFWFVYSIFALAKSICDYVAFIIPFYNEITLGVIVYLGFLNGAQQIYNMALRPLLKQYEADIDENLAELKEKAGELKEQAVDAAQDALRKTE